MTSMQFTKISALFLALILCLGLFAGCGGQAAQEPQETLNLIEESKSAPEPADIQEAQATEPQSEAVSQPEAPAEEDTPEESDSEDLIPLQPEDMPEDAGDTVLPLGDAPEDQEALADEPETAPEGAAVTEDGEYTSPEEVAAYIHQFGHLPGNFITKSKARDLGWDNSRGNLWDVAPGKSIGGDRFGNYEGLLPKGSYRECDVNYEGGYRGAERLIYGEDGSVYYTNDHYSSFTQLY